MLPKQTNVPEKFNFVLLATLNNQEELFFSDALDLRTAQIEARALFGTWTAQNEYIKLNLIKKTFHTIMP